MHTYAANRRGILLMLAAMTLFTVNDTLLKLASASYPPGQIMAVRGVFASLMTLGLVKAMGELASLGRIGSPKVLIRAALEALVSFLFITSLSRLPIANVTAILQATPIILTLMAVLSGVERIGWRRWSAVLCGFAGVLVIVRPSAEGFNLYAGLALASAVGVAGRDFITSSIGHHVPAVVVTLSTSLAVTATGSALALGETWQPLATREILILLAAAAVVTAGNLGVVMALRAADLSAVSPFRYAAVLASIALGFLVFGDLPDAVSCLGILLIVASGIYAIHRQAVRSRRPPEDRVVPAAPEAAGTSH